jgi:hypothetical protein
MSSFGSGRDESTGGPHDGHSQNQSAMAAAGVALQTADVSVSQDAAADASASGLCSLEDVLCFFTCITR